MIPERTKSPSVSWVRVRAGLAVEVPKIGWLALVPADELVVPVAEAAALVVIASSPVVDRPMSTPPAPATRAAPAQTRALRRLRLVGVMKGSSCEAAVP